MDVSIGSVHSILKDNFTQYSFHTFWPQAELKTENW